MRSAGATALALGWLVWAPPAEAQFRKIGEMELRLSGLSATVENAEPVVPKNTPGGIRVLVRAGGVDLSIADLSRFLGHDFSVQGELSGPGLSQPLALPALQPGEELPADPLILLTPPISIAGNYRLSNLRIVAGGRTVLDVDPSSVPLKVIDQILVTQVTTRALTLDEIRGKGIVLDSDDYLGFEFTMGFKLDSKAIDLKFPVVFDRQGVAVPQPLSPPAAPSRDGFSLPTILPLLLQAEDVNGAPVEIPKVTMPSGVVRPVTIPAVLVIPGNVGYLKQFFSAQLYVSNGAPVGSKLNVRGIKATLKLPPGADLQLGTTDDPLALPELERDGRVITQPLNAEVRGIGADGVAGTSDDIAELAPAEQAQVEFLIRGEKEGFHQINFDLTAQLLGLPIGPVTVKGKAAGGVLVRNPFFNVTFTVPSVVRSGEHFKMRATVTNIGKGIGNDVSMTLDASRMSGLTLQGEGTQRIATLKAGDARSVEFEFVAQRTGKVVATYLKFDTQSGNTGQLNFTIGVGERNVPLSPDTLVLPASTDDLPADVVDAAMRVLGQAWSVANAPSGTLPPGVIRVSGQVVVKKALALAESGLRVTLGQSSDAAVRDLLYDFFSGAPVDPGFDQLLRTTEGGHAFVQAVGGALSDSAMQAGGGPGYEFDTARLVASAARFISFGWDGVKGDLALVDGAGRSSIRSTKLAASAVLTSQNVVGAVLMPLGSDIMLGLATQPSVGPYRWEFRAAEPGTGGLAVTFARPDGSFGRALWSGAVSEGSIVRVTTDESGQATVQVDLNGDGVFENTDSPSVNTLPADGPRLLAAAIIGPETLDGAGPWGFQAALVFDRVVGESSAALVTNYSIPSNQLRSARRQLSGRLVFAALALPEGPYVPNRVTARGIEDTRGVPGAEITMPLMSRLGGSGPGASPEIGAVVSGRVLDGDGTPLSGRAVTYAQFPSLVCTDAIAPAGFAAPLTDQNGAFELRYVRQDLCGNPFQLFTIDPSTGARRSQSLYVRSPGQQIVADFVMLATGSVTGTVRNYQNQPVAGARVTVLSQTETQVGAATVTDASGRYSVSGVTVGPVSVRVGKGNGVGSAAGRIDRANLPAVIDVTIFDGAAQAHGTVWTVGVDGTKLAVGAVVTYYITPGPQAMAVTSSDGQGRYSFTGMPVGGFMIKAQANTRDFKIETGVNPGLEDLQVNLSVEIPPPTSLGYVEGQVVMPDGSPAEGVIVTSGAGSVLSGTSGLFVLPVVPQVSAHVVNATTRDRKRTGQTAVSVVSGGDRATGVRIVLSSLGAAEFTVLDMGGQPLPGRTVKLLDSRFDPCGRSSAVTDALGLARFTSLGVGAVIAQVVNEGEIVDAARGSLSVTGEGSTGFGVLRIETRASTISGVVVDTAGNSVLGAEVELRSLAFIQDPGASICGMQSSITHRARTGRDGSFRFTSVHPGRVYVTANQPDFAPTPVTVAQDLAAGTSADFTLRLVSTIAGKVTGVVYEPDGLTNAGPGVEVTMTGLLPDVIVVTNGRGEFSFPEVFPQGGYTITARDPLTGLVEQGRIFATAGVPLQHDIRLKGRATVRVRVETADAQAVTAAYVTLREIAYPNRTFEGVLDASSQGRVDFPGVFEGQVSIEVRDPLGRTGGRNALTIPTGSTLVETTVRVTTTGTIRGRFLRPAGDDSAIPYGSVRLLVGGRLIGQVTTTATEPAGAYEFSYVPAGAFRLEGLDPLTGRTGFATGVIEDEGEIVQVDMRAQAIGTVTGIVTENGAARGGARVELTSGNYVATTMSDALGKYIVQGVPEGHVVASADLGFNGGSAFLRGTASATLTGEGTTVDLNVALRDSGRVAGRVLKAGPGDDPAGVTAISIYVGGVGGGFVTGSTDENGEFEFTRVPAGMAALTVDALGSDDFASGTVDVPAGGDATPVTLRLNGIGGLHGVGQDSLGGSVQGRVTITYGPSERRRSASLELASNGSFTLPRVLAGPFTAVLNVTTSGLPRYGTAAGTIEDGRTTEVVVRLQDSATVVGRVLRADGSTPAYGSAVTLNLPGTGASSTVQAQTDGRFTFRGVTLGVFILRANDPVTAGLAQASGTTTTKKEVVDIGDLVLDLTLQVSSVDPAAGTSEVTVNQSVRVTFTDPLQYLGLIRVLNGTSQVSEPGTLSPDGRVVTLLPFGATWPDSRELTVEATTAVTDVFGRHPAQTFTSRFRTQDLSPPAVLSIAPANGASQVESGASIVVTFSEALSGTTDLVNLIRLSQDGIVYSGVTTLVEPGDTQAIFVPASPLPRSATLSIVVNGARDLVGNTQTTPVQTSFRSVESRGAIVGQVFLSDRMTPASGSDVTIRRNAAAIATAQTASDGRFTISDLALGSFTVSVTDPLTLAIAQGSGILASDGQVLNLGNLILQDNAATVKGQVFKADGVTPAGGTSVELRLLSSGAIFTASTDEGGRFLFVRVLAGPATVVVTSAASPDFASANVEVPTTGEVALTLRMTGLGALTGLAIGSNGLPTSGVLNVSGGPSQRPYAYLQVAVAPDGRFAFPSLLAGAVTLQLQSGPAGGPFLYGTATGMVVDGQTTELNVQLQFSGAVKGRLLKADGASPADGARARIDLQSGGRLNTVAGSDGLFAFNGVALGAFTLNAIDPVTNSTLSRSGLSLNSNGQVLEMGDLVLQIDTTSPSLSLSYPSTGSWTNTRPFIQVVFTDNQSGIEPGSGVLRLDGIDTGTVASSTSPYMQFSPGTLAEGQHVIDASIGDRAQNVATLHATFSVDATPPTPAVITSPAPGAILSGIVDFPVTSFDTRSGLRGVRILDGDAVRATTASPYETPVIDTRFMAEGRHTLTATAFDNVFNYAPAGPPLSVIVDNRSLSLTLTTPSNGQRIRDTVAVAVTPSEAVDHVVFTLGSLVAEFTQPPYQIAFDTSSLAEGAHGLLISAVGPIGETANVTSSVFVDRTPPTGPDLAVVAAEDSGNGKALVTGSTGAAEAGGRVEVRKPGSATFVTAPVASDGSFATRLAAAAGETIEIRALDSLDNAGPWRSLQVTSSPSGDAIPELGMSLWVKADVGILTDAAGFVTAWTDQSGNSNDLIQNTAAQRPLKVPNGFNGFPVVRFNGEWNQAQDFLNFKTKISDIRTVFWVAKEDAPGSQPDDRALFGLKSTNYYEPDAFRAGYGAPGTLWNSSSGPVVEGVTFLNGQVVDGTTTDRPQRMSVISLSMSSSAAADMLGGSYGQGSWWGDFAEVIVYSRTLTDAERAQVEAYLIRKYRLYVPASAPRISPSGGILDQPAVVSLLAQPGAAIRYTLDGSEPSESSPEYGQVFTVSTTTTVKARAYAANLDPSETATVTFLAPSSIPSRDGMAVWVRADAGLATDIVRASVWSDQSDRNNPLTQTHPIRQPVLISNAVNGLPALRFDGEQDGLTFQTQLAAIRTAFWVVRQDPNTYENSRSLFGGPANDFYGGYGTPGSIWEGYYGKTGPVRGGSTFLNGVPVDGTTMSRPQQMSVISLVTTGPAAASELAGGSYNRWRGDIAEVIVYDRALSSEERASVESYLMSRYDITPGAFLAYGAVQVRLRQGGAYAYLDGSVTLTSDNPAAPESDRTRTINLQSGWATATMPFGNISATVNYDGADRVATGTLSTFQLDLSVKIPVPPITGVVFATDGVTPLPDVLVSAGTRQTRTDNLGRYRLEDPPVGFQPVLFDYQGNVDSAYVTVVFSQPTTLNKVHPYAAAQVIRIVSRDGNPVLGATVTTCISGSAPASCAPSVATDSAGEVRYVGVPVALASGPYSGVSQRTAALRSDGAFGETTWYAYSNFGQTITITLQPPGTVRGRVLTPSASPVRNAPVEADDANGNYLADGRTDDQGAYEFRGLGGRDVTVYAWSEDYFFQARQSVAVAVGAEVVLELVLPIATVDVVLHDPAGQPYANQTVDVTTSGPRTTSQLTDATGRASFLVGPGFTQVIAQAPELAAAEFQIALGETRSVALVAGSHHGPRAIGEFNVSGSFEGSITPAQFDLYRANAAGVFLSSESADGRSEARVASYDGSGSNRTPVYYHQTLFVPTGAGFARSLTTFTNPSDSEVTINAVASLSVYGNAISTPGSATVDGAYSVVFGRDADWFCNEGCFIQSTLTLPPHGTKALLTFTTMDPALIPSLLDFSAAGAFADLSDADRAAIQNFDVPSPAEVLIEGIAQSETGDALGGAAVAIARGDTVVAQGIAAADGSFSFAFSGPTGTYRVVFALGDQLFEATIQILASGTQSLGSLRALESIARGSVRLRLVDGTGASVEGLEVSARSTRFLGLDGPVVGLTDAQGVVVIPGLFSGLNRIDTPLGPAFVRIVLGAAAPVWLQTGGGPVRASGRVTLRGAPVAGAAVIAARHDDALGEEVVVARTTTDATGRYTLKGLPEGEANGVNVYAWDLGPDRSGSSRVYVPVGSSSVVVNSVELSTAEEFASVRIRGFLDPSGARAAGYVASLRVSGAPFPFELKLDAQGEGHLSGLPAGVEVEVAVRGAGGFGRERVWLDASAEMTLNIKVGDRVALPKSLSSYRFDGQTVSELDGCSPFCLSAESQMSGTYLQGASSAAQTLNGRELIVTSPVSGGAGASSLVKMTRRLFVPPDGRFARMIDVIENTGSVPAAASYSANAAASSYPGNLVEILGDGVVDQTDSAFVVRSDQPSAETTGFVLWRPDGLVPSQISITNYGYYEGSSPRWQDVPVAAGQKVAFMSFVVFDRGTGADTVAERTQALMNLTDPLALEGMSMLDRAQVLNFTLDSSVTATVEGTAQTADGSAISGAAVAIGIGDAVTAQGVTGADGGFSLAFTGRAGTYRLVFLSGNDIFEAIVQISASGSLSMGPLRAMPRGSARLIVEDESGASVGSLSVSVLPASFFGLDTEVAGLTDAQGVAVVEGLIPGLHRIDTPLGPAFVRVVSGKETTVRLHRGDGPATGTGRVTLAGVPVAGSVVVATRWDPVAFKNVTQARATTGPDGRYTLDGLREDDYVPVYAWDPDLYRNASTGFFAEPGVGTVSVPEIALATDDSIGSVLVRASVESSGEPASSHVATIELEGWPFSVDVALDALGEARMAGLPGGNSVIVTVTGPGGFGREAGVLTSRTETLLNVPIGDRVSLPALLSPFAFSGGLLSETPNACTPFCVYPSAATNQASEPWSSAYSASVDASGRDLTVVFRTPVQGGQVSPLRLTRRLYVPAGGQFARIVDVVENVGSASTEVRYDLDQYLEPPLGILTEVLDGVVSPEDAAFVFQSDQPAKDTTGFVIRGAGGTLPASVVPTADNQGAFAQWNFALEPGQRVGLMSFVVFDRGAGAATVVSRVQALMNLTHPLALQGLSPEDRALILNWILP